MRGDSIIDRIERYGYPEPEPDPVRCPVCGDECIRVFIRYADGEVIGCDACAFDYDAETWSEETYER